jgi:hypothetical protein
MQDKLFLSGRNHTSCAAVSVNAVRNELGLKPLVKQSSAVELSCNNSSHSFMAAWYCSDEVIVALFVAVWCLSTNQYFLVLIGHWGAFN